MSLAWVRKTTIALYLRHLLAARLFPGFSPESDIFCSSRQATKRHCLPERHSFSRLRAAPHGSPTRERGLSREEHPRPTFLGAPRAAMERQRGDPCQTVCQPEGAWLSWIRRHLPGSPRPRRPVSTCLAPAFPTQPRRDRFIIAAIPLVPCGEGAQSNCLEEANPRGMAYVRQEVDGCWSRLPCHESPSDTNRLAPWGN